jgi:hypothetical protein
MVLTAYIVLSPATNSSCHRHRRIEGFAAPGRADLTSADLTPATGARTTRFCRPLQSPFVCVSSIAHRSCRPALQSRFTPDAAASTASLPASVTIAIRPSWGWDGGINKSVSTKRRSEIFLTRALDTKLAGQPVGRISRRRRAANPLVQATSSVGIFLIDSPSSCCAGLHC